MPCTKITWNLKYFYTLTSQSTSTGKRNQISDYGSTKISRHYNF